MVVNIIFWLMAIVAVGAAVTVITANNLVHAVLGLVLTAVALGVVWLLLGAEFLSLSLILVYVGAVITLLLFVVMMLPLPSAMAKRSLVSVVSALSLLTLLVVIIIATVNNFFLGVPRPLLFMPDYGTVQTLGATLYTRYIYPVEIMGVILLFALFAAISLVKNSAQAAAVRKRQAVAEQLRADPKQRLRLVDLPREGDDA